MDKADAYEVLARYYDQLMDEVDYDHWCDYVLSLVEKAEGGDGSGSGSGTRGGSGQSPASPSWLQGRQVLDLACGTGQFSYRLRQRGMAVTAVDHSPEMLAVAEERARSKGLDITFICQDMRELELPYTYDLVLCLCDSLNYLLEVEDLALALENGAGVLKPGGHFIFDVNTAYKLTTIYGNHTYAAIWVILRISGKMSISLTPSCAIWTWFLCLRRRKEEEEGPFLFEKLSESHVERAYPPELIRELIMGAGLELLGEYADLTLAAPGPTTQRITFHCLRPL